MLHPWRTIALEQRMAELWNNERPRGIAAEEDAIRRAQERIAIREKIAAKKKAAAEAALNPEREPPF
jgi:hypothetical protein